MNKIFLLQPESFGNFPGFHIKSLILCVTHGKGLSGQRAVADDGREKLLLAHIGKQKTDGIIAHRQSGNNIFAVDIIHFSAVFFYISVKEILKEPTVSFEAACEYKASFPFRTQLR